MVDFGMGRSWSANQRRPPSAKKNVDDFLDKETRRRPVTAAGVRPAKLAPTENFVHAAVQHIRQTVPRVGVTMDTHLFVSALATEEDLRQLRKAGPRCSGLTLALRWTQPPQPCRLTQALLLRLTAAANHASGILQMTSTIMQPPPTTTRCHRASHCRHTRPRRRRRRCRRLASMGGIGLSRATRAMLQAFRTESF